MVVNSQYKLIEKIITGFRFSKKNKKLLERITFLNSKNFLKNRKIVIPKEPFFAKNCWKGALKFNKIISDWKISNHYPFLIKGIKSKKFVNSQKKKLKKFITRKC